MADRKTIDVDVARWLGFICDRTCPHEGRYIDIYDICGRVAAYRDGDPIVGFDCDAFMRAFGATDAFSGSSEMRLVGKSGEGCAADMLMGMGDEDSLTIRCGSFSADVLKRDGAFVSPQLDDDGSAILCPDDVIERFCRAAWDNAIEGGMDEASAAWVGFIGPLRSFCAYGGRTVSVAYDCSRRMFVARMRLSNGVEHSVATPHVIDALTWSFDRIFCQAKARAVAFDDRDAMCVCESHGLCIVKRMSVDGVFPVGLDMFPNVEMGYEVMQSVLGKGFFQAFLDDGPGKGGMDADDFAEYAYENCDW